MVQEGEIITPEMEYLTEKDKFKILCNKIFNFIVDAEMNDKSKYMQAVHYSLVSLHACEASSSTLEYDFTSAGLSFYYLCRSCPVPENEFASDLDTLIHVSMPTLWEKRQGSLVLL